MVAHPINFLRAAQGGLRGQRRRLRVAGRHVLARLNKGRLLLRGVGGRTVILGFNHVLVRYFL
jgi:hypothetical protein